MIIEIVKGMAFTLQQLFRKPITLQWPEEQKPAPTRHNVAKIWRDSSPLLASATMVSNTFDGGGTRRPLE